MSDGICPYCHGTGWNDAERDRMARLVMRDAYLRVRSWLVDEIDRLDVEGALHPEATDPPPAGSGGSDD